jgi:hypothetical protein
MGERREKDKVIKGIKERRKRMKNHSTQEVIFH